MNPVIGDLKKFYWSPIKVNDIRWNFEKFLITGDGMPFKRYNHIMKSNNKHGPNIILNVLFHVGYRYELHCPIEIVEKDIADLL